MEVCGRTGDWSCGDQENPNMGTPKQHLTGSSFSLRLSRPPSLFLTHFPKNLILEDTVRNNNNKKKVCLI